MSANSSPNTDAPHILLVGAGALAHSLAHALQAANYALTLQARNPEQLKELAASLPAAPPQLAWEEMLPKAPSIIWLAVKDDAVAELGAQFRQAYGDGPLLVHSSGALPESVLPGAQVAVAYPFQTFSKGRSVRLEQVPFFLRGEEAALKQIRPVVADLTHQVLPFPSEHPLALHLSGVLANNFVTLLAREAFRLLHYSHLPPEVLRPLMEETVAKIFELPPDQAQSGPAKRGDQPTLENHLEWLGKNLPELLPLYQLLTEHIARLHDPQDPHQPQHPTT